MNNTINVNYMTRTYNSFIKSQETRKTSGKSMADTIAEKMSGSEKTGEVAETAKTGAISTKDMTMEEYKQYIHDKISEIPMHPSQIQRSVAINISEAGFEAMKNDPEYEAWVLDGIKTDFSFNDPWGNLCGGNFTVHNFGATKEEYHGTSWYKGCYGNNDQSVFDSKSKDSFWEHRVENKQRLEKQVKKQQEKKQLQQAENEKAAMQKRLAHQRFLAEYQNRVMLSGHMTSTTTISNTSTSQMAASSYEASFIMTDAMM